MTHYQSERIPLIYILSSGRSGSTLLDMLLGLHPAVWTVGEAQILPWELRENRTPCGCGKPVLECGFWQTVLPRIPIDQGKYPIEYFRESHTGGRAIRWQLIPDLLRRRPSGKWKNAIKEYGELNALYMRAVKDEAEKVSGHPIQWLVDASKDMYRLFWLYHSGLFDLRIIHLVKDPRAFIYSMTKGGYQTLPKLFRYAGRWLFQNGMATHVWNDRDRLNKGVIRLRYEDLATTPQVTMNRLGQWLGIDYSEVDITSFRTTINHAISGNPMRWQSSTIQLDEKWRIGLSSRKACLSWLVTGVLARSYGYQNS